MLFLIDCTVYAFAALLAMNLISGHDIKGSRQIAETEMLAQLSPRLLHFDETNIIIFIT